MTFTPESIISILVLGFILLAAVAISSLYLAKILVPGATNGISPDVFTRLISFMEKALEFQLQQAATTASLSDDQFYIEGLKLLGYKVSGSPETGYTITPPTTSAL